MNSLTNPRRPADEAKAREIDVGRGSSTDTLSIEHLDRQSVDQAGVGSERPSPAGASIEVEAEKNILEGALREIERLRSIVNAPFSSAELRLIDKHCDWIAFKHAWNAVMKHRKIALSDKRSAK